MDKYVDKYDDKFDVRMMLRLEATHSNAFTPHPHSALLTSCYAKLIIKIIVT